ncbi:MAG: helix-turn-helix domain-containing protein [Candidatus Pacebacteria bacterium]|nr:helix-turn-helix domain-containing protein [Candidatus Paceibacterota bacterium]
MQIVHFTPPQLASIFEVNETTIKRWIWNGKLKANLTIGGHYRVSKDQLNIFFKKYPQISKNSYVIRRYNREKNKKIGEWEEYYELILINKHEEAFKLLQSLYVSGNDITVIIDNYFVPVLWKIGFEYNKGSISIYEEHRMSFRINEHLSRFEQFAKRNIKKSKKAILLCAKGENHIIPLQMLNLVLSKNNWDTHVLGVNISYEELEKAVNKIKPNMICITKSYTEDNPNKYLEKTSILAKRKKMLITLGGSGWNKKIKENKYKGILWFGSMGDFEKFLRKMY